MSFKRMPAPPPPTSPLPKKEMSNGEAIRAKYLALAEHMDTLIEAEAKFLATSRL